MLYERMEHADDRSAKAAYQSAVCMLEYAQAENIACLSAFDYYSTVSDNMED